MQDVPVETLYWSNKISMRGEALHPRVADLPPEAAGERAESQGQDIQSLIAAPMVYQGETIGLLGFDAVRTEKEWIESDIKLLKTLEAIFVNAMERKRADEALQESRRMLSTLIGNLPGMAYRCRNDSNWTMKSISESSQELTGYCPEELVKNHKIAYVELIHPADKGPVRKEVRAASDLHQHFGDGSFSARVKFTLSLIAIPALTHPLAPSLSQF